MIVFNGMLSSLLYTEFFFKHPAITEIYPLSLHDALPISDSSATAEASRTLRSLAFPVWSLTWPANNPPTRILLRGHLSRSEEHTSELQSLRHLVCRLLLEKKKEIRTSPIAAELHYHVIRR